MFFSQIQVNRFLYLITPDSCTRNTASGEYLKIYVSGNSGYIEVIKDCIACIDENVAEAISAGKKWSWNINDTTYTKIVSVIGD